MSKLWSGILVAGLLSTLTAAPGHAIEMFTFFGDGSRIGLPSLEVPIEAYPGIPLRSDRIRARRRGMRSIPAPQTQPGVTIRAMPTEQAAPLPRAVPARRGPDASGRSSAGAGQRQTAAGASGLPVPPLPPEPDDLLQPPAASQDNTAGRRQTSAQPVTDTSTRPLNVQPPLADPR
jgi:hypothetical protein